MYFCVLFFQDMNENIRLQELKNYKILDTEVDKELDEIVTIASAILDTPISLISLVDENRQWFKSKKGLAVSETPREEAFCQHALHQPDEVLVVNDVFNDERFRLNPLVLGDPNIRFYAGAPLQTPTGNVLGTLCIIDNKTRKISENQKKALQLLAKKVMDHLNTRKLLLDQKEIIETNAAKLKKLTDRAPGAIFQLRITPDGKRNFSFMSKGIQNIHPDLDMEKLKEDPEIAFKVIHPEDLPLVLDELKGSFKNLHDWDQEYRVVSKDGKVYWHWVNATPEREPDGTVVWHGTFQDVTHKKEYIKALEQILFDISHVMRKPVSTLMGLSNAIDVSLDDEKRLREFFEISKTVTEELDSYIRILNTNYTKIKKEADLEIT